MNKVNVLEHFSKHPEWPGTQTILKHLQKHGYQAVLAGGCVRDALLGITAKDFDVATSATPDQVEQVFEKTVAIGKSFGVMMVPVQNGHVEVATFRKDGEYKDGRHPESVEFSSREEDARRRDFTINALFYDSQSDQVIDCVDGIVDLQAGVLRAVGDPSLRFEEDKLRMLRAIRFSAQLDFAIESSTFSAIVAQADELNLVAMERITAELLKLLSGKNPIRGLNGLAQAGLWNSIWPWFDLPFQSDQASQQNYLQAKLTIQELPLPASPLVLLGVLLTSQLLVRGKGGLKAIRAGMGRLKLPKKDMEAVLWSTSKLCDLYEMMQSEHTLDIAVVLPWFEDERSSLLVDVLGAYANNPPSSLSGNSITGNWFATAFQQIQNQLRLISEAYGGWPEPLLSGEDLLSCGFSRGPELGEALSELRSQQLQLKIKTRAGALVFVKKFI